MKDELEIKNLILYSINKGYLFISVLMQEDCFEVKIFMHGSL
jgi:hypothetical protein